MTYRMPATVVTLNDLEGHLPVTGLFKCNPSNIYAAFYTISTDAVLARFLCISRASRFLYFYIVTADTWILQQAYYDNF